jgi:RNA recognition motif-containing protein
MNNKLFVGGIAWATDEEGLKEFFSKAGTVVEAKIVTDRETGRSRGFGFVTMATEEEAQAAIDMLNGQELDGRTLNINVAQPPKQQGEGGGRFNRSGGGNRGGFNRGGNRGGFDRAPRNDSDNSGSSDMSDAGASDDMDAEE